MPELTMQQKQAAKEIESKLRTIAEATETDCSLIVALLSQFPDSPIVVHWIGKEWIPDWFKGEVEDGVGLSKPMSVAEFQKFENTMQVMANASLPAHRIAEIKEAVAAGKRASVIHFHKTLHGRTGIWGFTWIWDKVGDGRS